MREMKDSGVEWIGEIPKNWEIRRFKNLGKGANGLTYSPNNIVDKEEGTLVLRSSNIQNGRLCYEDNIYVDVDVTNARVNKGDILICSRNGSPALIGKNAIINENINAYYGAFMMVYRCNEPEYIHYIMNAGVFDYYLAQFSTSTINQLTGNALSNMRIPYCCDKEEKIRIVNYLDSKCSKIDAIIEKQQAIIEKLKEYKLSVITEAVTKGLDSDVSLDSLDNIFYPVKPKNWNCLTINSCNMLYANGNYAEKYPRSDEMVNEGIPFIRANNVRDGKISLDNLVFLTEKKHNELKRGHLQPRDILICIRGAGIGECGLVPETLIEANLNAQLTVIRERPESLVLSEYLLYSLLSKNMKEQFKLNITGSALPQLSEKNLHRFSLLVPSINEQMKIVEFLNKECKLIDETIYKYEKMIPLFYNYKNSLIYEVVTGKKEV